jgi:hypothetical protein
VPEALQVTSPSPLVATADDTQSERNKFLWNQQRYTLENIKLADSKAGFVLTIAAALLSTNLLPSGHLYVHFVHATSGLRLFVDIIDIAGIICLVAAVLLSAWCIAPRIHSHGVASPVSWVNIARYPTPESFRSVNASMSSTMAADYLCEQVYFMSVICVRKHHLVSQAILCAATGACCIAIALITQ